MGWTQEVSNCSELKHLCDLPEARLLRMVCGSTCGCTDPLSQPFHKVGTWIFMGKTGRLWYDHFIYHFHGYFWPSPKRGGAWWLYRFMLETWRAGAGERWMQRPATWRLGWTFSLGTGQVWFRVNLVASPSFSPGERWRIFWDTYPDALSDFFGNNMSLLRRLIFSGVQQIFGMFFFIFLLVCLFLVKDLMNNCLGRNSRNSRDFSWETKVRNGGVSSDLILGGRDESQRMFWFARSHFAVCTFAWN